jgi:hypothetical protein
MYIAMKCLNEAEYVDRCIGDFHDLDFVEKIIVVDGDSTDFTVYKLKKFPKVEVHVHKWLLDYHYQEVIQSMIVLSYIPNGKLFFILDFDERMSDELKNTLGKIDKGEIPIANMQAVHFPRRTFEVLRYENSPYAIIGEDGWPIISHQIGQYPDLQCRLMRKFPEFHWINSPHHVPCGHTSERHLPGDIIHYERNNKNHRLDREKLWAFNQAKRKQLGLSADVFETRVNPDIAEYYDIEEWGFSAEEIRRAKNQKEKR